jgi:hypothetical protein
MNSSALIISEDNLAKASDYIARQFANHSWWPREQPYLAKQEFDLMKDSAISLSIWCRRWLDSGQIFKLKRALKS